MCLERPFDALYIDNNKLIMHVQWCIQLTAASSFVMTTSKQIHNIILQMITSTSGMTNDQLYTCMLVMATCQRMHKLNVL